MANVPHIQQQIDEAEAKLAALRVVPAVEEIKLKELLEDVAFEEAKKSAPKNFRLGRLRVDPGQVIFRQTLPVEVDKIRLAGDDEQKTNILSEATLRNCIIKPDIATFDAWKELYPGLWGEYVEAMSDHQRAYRRDRAGK